MVIRFVDDQKARLGVKPICRMLCEHGLEIIAAGVGEIDRIPGRKGDLTPEEHGYLHCGPSGAGHFVKIVHNAQCLRHPVPWAQMLTVLRRRANHTTLASSSSPSPVQA